MSNTVASQPPLFRRLWRGELGLASTFWIFAVAIPVAWAVASSFVLQAVDSSAVRVSLIAAAMVWHAFVAVALWRAAGRSARSQPWWLFSRAYVILVVLYEYALLSGLLRQATLGE